MINQIYTTGYAGKDISDLKPLTDALDAMLVDIRFSPYSEVLVWRKVYLKTLLGRKYQHILNLGNRSYKEDKITIQNLQLGIETLISLDTSAILFCACKELENCHRRVIAEELRKREIETVEIIDWKNFTGINPAY
jgi:hypothetical protein